MLKLKPSFRAGTLKLVIQYKQFTSDVQDESKKTTIKSAIKQNEIVTDKFRKQLAYIVERNKKPIRYQPLEKQHITSTADAVSEQSNAIILKLTNITGTLPIFTDTSESLTQASLETSFSEEIKHVSLKKVSKSSIKISDFKQILPTKVNITSVQLEKSYDLLTLEKNQMFAELDLSTAVVPLALHSKENNLLVDSFIQDVNEMYYKTSEKIGHWCLVVQKNSDLCYIKLDLFLKRPETPQYFVREQVVSLLSGFEEKTANWLCEAKQSTEKKEEKPVAAAAEKLPTAAESPLDQIKKIIENIIATLKQKIEEYKKKAQESKSK